MQPPEDGILQDIQTYRPVNKDAEDTNLCTQYDHNSAELFSLGQQQRQG